MVYGNTANLFNNTANLNRLEKLNRKILFILK